VHTPIATLSGGSGATPNLLEVDGAPGHIVRCAAELVDPVPPISPETSNERLRELFAGSTRQVAIAVLDAGRPIGIVNRHTFMEAYARPFAHELYGKKSCKVFMRPDPLVVDGGASIAEVARLAVAYGGRVLEDGFIVTSGGSYVGLGAGAGLVEALSDLEAERARQVRESIRYASTIQRSMLASSAASLARTLPDHVLLWEPREPVGGDCYCFRETSDGLAGAVLDCTGHGVPGAFMTSIAYAALEQALADPSLAQDPGRVLTHLNRFIKSTLRQGAPDRSEGDEAIGSADDGLDGAVFFLSKDRRELRVASARTPVFVRRSSGVEVVKGIGTSVGYASTPDDQVWPTSPIELDETTLVFVVTDGFTDQIGGLRHIAFGKQRLVSLLQSLLGGDTASTVAAFQQAHATWQGDEPRRDDATLLAFSTKAVH